MAPSLLNLAMFFAHFLSGAAAMPAVMKNSASFTKREGEKQEGLSLQIIIPLAVVGVIIVAGAIGLCWRRSVATWLDNRRRSPATAAQTRELTAEQLAGTINAATPAAGGPANRTRRTRRPRRTPSQISTTSLPAYAKEPGEQELVIFRGPEDMEDAGMPTATVVMEPLSEDEETLHSRNNSQASQYPPLPVTPMDTPLLNQNDSSGDLSVQLMAPLGDVTNRRSMDTLPSSEEGSSLAPAYEDRGEAPAYFEVIDHVSPNVTSGPPSGEEPIPPRRSGFRTLLHSIPNRLSLYGSSHTRAESTFSMVSSENTHVARETSMSRASHRPSGSGSGSLLNLAPFRTLSRQSHVDNLTSPSLISLNSISAPLSHTLTRTEFTYPKSGPTPEQLKLISSREGLTRFGVPYGADAIAYAASASRQELDVPPPEFDTSTPGSVGSSRLRASSNAADVLAAESSTTANAPPESILISDASSASLAHSETPPRNAPTENSELDPLQIPLPSSPTASMSELQPQPEIPLLDLPKFSTTAIGAPPASFRAPSKIRSFPQESRASSVSSFATAHETLASRRVPSDFGNDITLDNEVDSEVPTTPRIVSGHVLEPTDSTIQQAPRTTVNH